MRIIEKLIEEKFDNFWLQFVEEVVFFRNRILEKIASAPNDRKMTLNATRPKVPYICWPASPKFHSVLLYGRSFSSSWVFLCFSFSIGYNGEFEIFEKKIGNSKHQKSQTYCEDHWEENLGQVSKLFFLENFTPIVSHINENE